MGPTDSGNNQNNKIQSFLESLRASRGNGPKVDSLERGQLNPFKEVQAKKEIEQRRIDSFQSARQKEWNSVFSAKDRERDQKIEQIRQQLKSLAHHVGVLDKNILKAVETPVSYGGTYDESFFQHLQQKINLLSKSVSSTNTWLEAYSARSLKKGYYSQMAKSGGSSFTQANERVIATSVG